jgi:thiol-disulfide isomerase/thioredoxin
MSASAAPPTTPPQLPPHRKLLGVNTLWKGAKKERVDVPVATLEGKPLLLFFSGQWCPSCRLFKPRLKEFYKKMKDAGKEFEVVYVPQDRDEEEFEQAFEEHPWLALPLKEKRSHTRLSSMCGIQGVPTLVLVDQKGKIVTNQARRLLAKDPDGEQFPWVPPTVYEVLDKEHAYTHDGKRIPFKEFKERENGFAIYFAASFVRQCRFFTPKLVTTYLKMKESSGNDFEIILAPVEQDQDAFDDFWAEMPWPTLPAGSPALKKLREALRISNVPTLVTIKKGGEIVNMDAASVVEEDPEGNRYPWKPKELPPVSRFYPSQDVVSAVHENICVVLFVNGAANKVSPMQEFSRAALLWDAQRNADVDNMEDKIRFFTVDEEDAERGFLVSVLRALRLKAPLHGECSLVLFSLINMDRQLIPAPSMSAQEVTERVEAFRVRQMDTLGDGGAVDPSTKQEASAAAAAEAQANAK